MRALTVTPPWSGPIGARIKLRENRRRHMIKRADFGVPFAIHAGREVDLAVYNRIREIAPELWDGWDLRSEPTWPLWYRLSRVTSAVIAIATVDSVLDPLAHGIPLHDPDAFSSEPPDQRRWCFGPIVYVLRDVRALATPVRCRGWQGFWTLPPKIERAVVEQLGAAP
jgi:hypothetical protein